MPLMQGKSKKAFEHNVEAEMHAGKPQKQSLAIAYSVKRKNAKKKMADGGLIIEPASDEEIGEEMRPMKADKVSDQEVDDKANPMDAESVSDEEMKEDAKNMKPKYAKGGSVRDPLDEGGESEGHYDSVSSAIMARKRRAKAMADGGMVDLDENAREEPNNLDDMNYEALKKENYAEEHGLSELGQPEDSNEHGHELSDEDEHDMVTSIRNKIKAKRGY